MKFVSLSQLLGCPLFGSNSHLFTVPGFIVSLVRIKKKKKSLLLASYWPSQFCQSSWLQQAESGLVPSSPFPIGTRPSPSPVPQQPPVPQVWLRSLPRALGVGMGPSKPPREQHTAGWGGVQSGCCKRIPQQLPMPYAMPMLSFFTFSF